MSPHSPETREVAAAFSYLVCGCRVTRALIRGRRGYTFRKRPQGARALRGRVPCVGAEETCGVPSQPARRGRTPPLHAPKHCQGEPVHLPEATSGYPLGCSPQRSKEERSTREGGFPCRSVGRSAPAASHRNSNTASEPVSCRSCPAAHSREREPNAPHSAQPPASNQRQKQPQRCRCVPPARVRPNRQCR